MCLAQWRDRRSKGSSYDLLSAEVARIVKIEEYVHTPEIEQLFDVGAKRLLLPMASVGDIPTVPGELFARFQTSFYADPRDAVFKALGVE